MKIYFAGSIRSGRDDQDYYRAIINELKKYGNVLTEHIGDKNLSDQGEKDISDQEIFERDINWLKEADILVGEVTVASLGVGYEIGIAQSIGKKIFLLHRPAPGKRLSAMLSGNSYLKIAKYEKIEEIPEVLKSFFA